MVYIRFLAILQLLQSFLEPDAERIIASLGHDLCRSLYGLVLVWCPLL